MTLKNAYTIKPYDVQPGDEFLSVIKAIVQWDGTYKIYRCAWEGSEAEIPQGSIIYNSEEVAKSIFPVLIDAGCEPG